MATAATVPSALQPGTLEHFCAFASRLKLPPPVAGQKTKRRRPGQAFAAANTDAVSRKSGAPAPLIIEPFQRRILADYFDGVAETFVLLPKGNAKSMLMAALALYHVCFVDEAEAYIFAASRDQASRLLHYAAGFVRRSKTLQRHLLLRLGFREIRARRDGGTLKVLAADPDTADGIGPTLVLCDEMHRWKTLEAYTLAKEGLGKRDGQLIGISTAGEDENGAFGRMRKEALRHLPLGEQAGAYRYAPSPSGEFVWHEWSLQPTDDLENMELVKTANPLAQITVDALRDRFDSPGTRRAWWARFVCGIWTRDDDAAISAMEWAPCQVDECEIPSAAGEVFIGVDFGWRKDTTALVPVWAMGTDPLVVRVDRRLEILTPPGDGQSLSTDLVWEAIGRLSALWPDATFVVDPNANAEHVAQRIEGELGHRVILQAQDPSPMADAAGKVMELIREGRVEHPGNLEFSSHVLACYLKGVGGEKFRFVKGQGGSFIDAAIGFAMAVRQLSVAADAPPPLEPFVIS